MWEAIDPSKISHIGLITGVWLQAKNVVILPAYIKFRNKEDYVIVAKTAVIGFTYLPE